ncbi:MAG: ABC transporter ATP-binding protein [Erysipelotrichaceae bacterium]|nr:ABC transporter ATP-binding protein [Erysipelotrichaceae bacterium]
MLKINNISKSFDTKKVLNNLSLEVNDGSIFGLVGVNGAGKSTLLRCVAGIYRTDEGNVEFNGIDTYKDENIRKDIFFVNDDPYYPMASNIKSLKEFYSSYYPFDEVVYFKTLKLFGLDENKPVNTFSKGMKRQTLLLFALAIRPKLLLLDEAFDGLDPLVRYNLKKSLYEFIEDSHATIIISSHNLKELEDICDSYGILENGKIETYGDLLESKQNINKYQLAFKKEPDESAFEKFDILHQSKEGSVYSLVIKGDKEETVKELKKLKPIILDTLSVNFEELFIYEHEGGNR